MFVSVIPGILASFWNQQAGLAIGIGGIVIGLLCFINGIGIGRLFGLLVYAILGKVLSPVANFAEEATAGPNRDSYSDRLIEWLAQGWNSQRRSYAVWGAAICIGVAAGWALATQDYNAIVAGRSGWILPYLAKTSPLETGFILVVEMFTSLLGGLLLVIFSPPFRRPAILFATAGAVFGAIVGISVEQIFRLASFFAIYALGAMLVLAPLGIWVFGTSPSDDED